MKIGIIHTSRDRPTIALETCKAWMDNRRSNLNITYHLGVEDVDVDYASAIKELKSLYGDEINVRVFSGRRIRLKEVIPTEDELLNGDILTANIKGNILAQESNADWFICAADNFFPAIGWDSLMQPSLEAHKDKIAMLGYSSQIRRHLISHPIMTRKFFNWNDNEIMYSGYYHTHGDCELFVKSLKTGVLYRLPSELDPIHKHSYFGTAKEDDLCLLNNSKASYAQGERVWTKRQHIDWVI